MNCEESEQRFLLFVKSNPQTAAIVLENMGADKIIFRRHSDSVEIDFSVPIGHKLSQIEKQIGDFISMNPVKEDFSNLSTREMLELVEELIKEERFWEAHNVLEDIWKKQNGQNKKTVHDIIGVVVSQIKIQMGQMETGEKVYYRNLNALRADQVSEITEQLPEDFTYPLKLKMSALLQII